MTGPEHYREAERLLGEDPSEPNVLKSAHVHAMLAVAAAVAVSRFEGAEWFDAAGIKPRPDDIAALGGDEPEAVP